MNRVCLLIGALLMVVCQLGCSSTTQYVLTDAQSNIQVRHFRFTSDNVAFKSDAHWSVTQRVLKGGKQEGVRIITIDNGVLEIDIIPTRGMNVLEVRHKQHKGLRLGWNSPVKEVVHPAFIDLEGRGGLGWLDGFNELMVRCGLEFAGHPGLDKFTTNTGDSAEMELTLHGKVGNIPASRVEVIVDPSPPHRIRVRGVVYERMFYGPKLKLVAEISTTPGSDTFRIDDTITNQGPSDQEFQIIYHTNFGNPLLGKGAKILTPVKSITPMNAHASKGIDHYDTYAGPTNGFIEEVYLIEPHADKDGNTLAVLQNADGDRAASITWSTKQLPYLTIWKNTAAVDDGYVTGIEPGTGYPFNRRVERHYGRVPKLKPGAIRRFTLEFGLHVGQEAVAKKVAEVEAVAAGRKAEVIREAPAIPE